MFRLRASGFWGFGLLTSDFWLLASGFWLLASGLRLRRLRACRLRFWDLPEAWDL